MVSLNEYILNLLSPFEADGIPVRLLFYNGQKNSYITFEQTDADESLSGDDTLLGYVDYYDVDVYTQGNLNKLVNRVKELMVDGGFVWQVSRTSQDMYDETTQYYHKTLCFAIERMN